MPLNPPGKDMRSVAAAYPMKRSNSLTVALPTSLVADAPHLREKTQKIGLIGRTAAIFRVDNITIYRDEKQLRTTDQALIRLLLEYMATPQYLRRTLFKIRPELRFAGILPPLRTPNHPTGKSSRDLRPGEYREGVVTEVTQTVSRVDIGVEKPAVLEGSVPVHRRVNVCVESIDREVKVRAASWEDIPQYWGYTVDVVPRTLGEILQVKRFDLTIATSKYGKPLASLLSSLKQRWKDARCTMIAFGAPARGLNEILRDEGLKLEDAFDFTVNTVSDQGTETLRCEEAVMASLAALHFASEL